jgi:hypothetical protein
VCGHCFNALGYKLKTGRPQHHKQDLEAQAAVKKFQSEADPLKLQRWFSDEMRFGLHNVKHQNTIKMVLDKIG